MTDLLQLDAIEKSYRRGERRLRVLDGLSLTVQPGQIVALLGSRYEGKTTLLKIAAGLERPDAGKVSFEGQDLTRLRTRQRERLLAGRIAWISREGAGLEFRVLDYVGLPLLIARRRSSEVEDAAVLALERVGAPDVAQRRWQELSNWERVLVSFARGIILRPRLLVIDDLFDGLGMSKTQQAGELLSTFVSDFGCGVLISVSDAEAAIAADRVCSFERGRLRLLSGQDQTAEVIEFPGAADAREGRDATRADG